MDIKLLNEQISKYIQEDNTELKVGDSVKVIDSESMAKGYKGVVDSIEGSTIKVKLPDGPEGNLEDKYTIIPFKDKELQRLTEEAQGFDIKVGYDKHLEGNLTFKKQGNKYKLFMPSKYDPLYMDFSSLKSRTYETEEDARKDIEHKLSTIKANNPMVK